MRTGPWTIAEAKSKFSELIDQAAEGPQTITRNGRTAGIVVSPEEWERKAKRIGNLAEFLAGSPFARIEAEAPAKQGANQKGRSVSYLLDTNVISEWAKPTPNPGPRTLARRGR